MSKSDLNGIKKTFKKNFNAIILASALFLPMALISLNLRRTLGIGIIFSIPVTVFIYYFLIPFILDLISTTILLYFLKKNRIDIKKIFSVSYSNIFLTVFLVLFLPIQSLKLKFVIPIQFIFEAGPLSLLYVLSYIIISFIYIYIVISLVLLLIKKKHLSNSIIGIVILIILVSLHYLNW